MWRRVEAYPISELLQSQFFISRRTYNTTELLHCPGCPSTDDPNTVPFTIIKPSSIAAAPTPGTPYLIKTPKTENIRHPKLAIDRLAGQQ